MTYVAVVVGRGYTIDSRAIDISSIMYILVKEALMDG